MCFPLNTAPERAASREHTRSLLCRTNIRISVQASAHVDNSVQMDVSRHAAMVVARQARHTLGPCFFGPEVTSDVAAWHCSPRRSSCLLIEDHVQTSTRSATPSPQTSYILMSEAHTKHTTSTSQASHLLIDQLHTSRPQPRPARPAPD